MTRYTIPITLQTIPVDCLLHVGTYLGHYHPFHIGDIEDITLAAILNDREMLEHYMKRYDESQVSRKVARSGNLSALQWVIEKGCSINRYNSINAAFSGNLKMLKWLHKKGCPLGIETCDVAAESGNLEMIKWLHRNGCRMGDAHEIAAKRGNLEMLKWLHSHVRPCRETEFNYAAWHDQLDVMKWLHSQGCPWNDTVFYATGHSSNVEMQQWVKDNLVSK
jgi:hypothetical protein